MRANGYTLTFNSLWARLGAFGVMLTLALVIPAFGWPQPITGTLVNALLLVTVELLGVGPAIALGALTPLGGLMHGVLPLPMAVMIPFIMLGNATFVSLYAALRGRNRFAALGVAAVAKFAALYGAVTLLAVRPLELTLGGAARAVAMPAALINMMSWPQLVTALAGGLLAFALLRLRK
jgi:hypothetical protein